MPKHEISQTSDNTSPPKQHGELSAHVHKEAGFSHVGDQTGNQAWSQMTGAEQRGAEPLSQGAQAGRAGNDSIDFGAHGNIYAQSDNRSHEGLISSAPNRSQEISASGTPGQTENSGLGQERYAGNASASVDAAADKVGDKQTRSVSPTDSTAAPGADNHVRFDASTAKYDGKQFYDMSLHEARNTPTDTLKRVNQNNYDNLHQRMSDIHEKMPDIVMRGVDSLGKDDMEKLANKSSEPFSEHSHGGEYFAYSRQKPQTPKESLDHLAAHLTKAQTFADGVDQNGGVYAFAYKPIVERTPGEQKRVQDMPRPFEANNYAGEAKLSLNNSTLNHIATLSGEDAYIPADLKSDPTIPQNHFEPMHGYRATKGIDKVLSGIESQHAEYLADVRRRRETQERAQSEAHEAGWYSRISNSLKSWF